MKDMHLIALSSIPDIGPVTIRRLIKVFGSPEAVFKASVRELKSVEKVGDKMAKGIKSFSGWEALEGNLRRLAAEGVGVVSYDSDEYPEMLGHIQDSPVILYIKGDIKKDDKYAIAIVGTRKPTPYGRSVTESMASELADMGFTVVSGLARGIDSSAHVGALNAGGRSIGVLGSGIDVPYPPENKGLMEKVSGSGCVMTEFPPGTSPNRENFPRRNRIISGLSLGVLVVEAQADSGSLITAGCALEQGKEVFSIPGNINSVNSNGTNDLIKKGAKLVLGVKDIIEELSPILKGFIKSEKKANIELSHEEKTVCCVLSGEPRHIDEISRDCGISSSRTLGILLSLELKGVASASEGKRYFLR
jgi:DNA processing protein